MFDTGAVETLIIWENLEYYRVQCKLPDSDTNEVIFVKEEDEKRALIDPDTGVEREITEKQLLTEWILENYGDLGLKLEFVTDKSAEGNQFCVGFGGLGGILR